MGRSKKRAQRVKRAARAKQERPERGQDPRLIASRVLEEGGVPVTEETWIVAISPIEMDDGTSFAWSTPQAVVFNLVEANKYLKRGARDRRNIMARLVREGDSLKPKNNSATLDCVSDLQHAMFSAFTAIEALANHGVDMLDDDREVEMRDKKIPRTEMVRRLGTEDKFKHVLPMLDQCERIAGTVAWEKLRAMKRLRDELVHVPDRGPGSDPTVRTAYDRLLLGDADDCVQDARLIIESAWPGFLPDHVLSVLSE